MVTKGKRKTVKKQTTKKKTVAKRKTVTKRKAITKRKTAVRRKTTHKTAKKYDGRAAIRAAEGKVKLISRTASSFPDSQKVVELSTVIQQGGLIESADKVSAGDLPGNTQVIAVNATNMQKIKNFASEHKSIIVKVLVGATAVGGIALLATKHKEIQSGLSSLVAKLKDRNQTIRSKFMGLFSKKSSAPSTPSTAPPTPPNPIV